MGEDEQKVGEGEQKVGEGQQKWERVSKSGRWSKNSFYYPI